MKIGTKLQMDNGALGIQEGVIIEDDGWEGIIRWDVEEFEDDEQLGDNFNEFGIRILPNDWQFKYLNDDGTRKIYK